MQQDGHQDGQQSEQQGEHQETLFAFGLGYSALALAKRLSQRGWHTTGTVRSAQKAEKLASLNVPALVFNGAEVVNIAHAAHWLVSAPPNGDGCPIFTHFKSQAHHAASITYLSTTGVYGDLQGGWAFEWTPTNASSDRARNRVTAETQWASTGRPFRSVRLPGIYGPGRSPFTRVRAGSAQRIIKPGQVFSRVHVDDIASGLEAMMLRPDALGIFHLCDDVPARPQDVTAYAAKLLGLPAPEAVDFESAALSAMARSFYAECKRISNARAKSALGWFPKYPDYKVGLKAVLDVEQGTETTP